MSSHVTKMAKKFLMKAGWGRIDANKRPHGTIFKTIPKAPVEHGQLHSL